MPEPTLGDYWESIYRRRWIILLVMIVAVVFAWRLSDLIAPRYEAKAVFYVPQDIVGANAGPEAGIARMPGGVHELAETYITVLKAADTFRVIAERFDKEYAELFKDVDFVVTRQSLIRVFVRDEDAEVAANVANGFVDYFKEFHRNVIEGQLRDTLANVEQKITEVQRRKQDVEDAIQQFLEQHGIASLATEMVELEEQRLRFGENVQLALVNQRQLEERIHGVEAQLRTEAEAYAAGEITLPGAVIDSLKDRLVRIEVEIAGRSTDFRPDHPEMLALRQRHEEAKKSLEREIARVVASKSKLPGTLYARLRERLVGHYVDLAANQARIAGLKQSIDNISQRIQAMPALTVELARLREEAARREALLGNLFATRNFLTMRLLQRKEAAIVLERARAPKRPVFPNQVLNMGIAAAGGLIAGIIYALFLDYIEKRHHLRKLREIELQEWAQTL